MTSHTPTPWVVRGSRIYDANDEETAVATRASPRNRAHTKETANRIVACVNACAGINPEAVKDLVKTLEAARCLLADLGHEDTVENPTFQRIVAALAKAREIEP